MIVVNALFRFFINYFSFHQGSNEVAETSSEIIFGKVERVVLSALRVAASAAWILAPKRRFLRLAANGHRLEDKTIHLIGVPITGV